MTALIKLARKFQLKLAQDPFVEMEARPEEEKELAWNALNTLKEIGDQSQYNFDAIDNYMSPEKAHYFFPNIQDAKNVFQLKNLKDHIQPFVSDARTKYREMYGHPDIMNKMSFEERKEIETNSSMASDLTGMFDSLQYNNSNFAAKAAQIQAKINEIEMMQSNKQDAEIKQFMDKEREDQAMKAKSIEGKSPFTTQDVTKIISASVNEIKLYVQNALKQKLQGNQKIVFTFYPNGNVGVSGQDLRIVNAIRRGFVLKLQLDLRGYMTNFKKYFTGPVNYELSI
jgi:hypothetical protein